MIKPVAKKRRTMGQCSSYGCQNEASGTFCGSCRSRLSRLADPERYAYQNLKHRAKERGKEFTLTLEEFKEFCVKSEYMKGKGKTIGSYNIDRIDNTKGYTRDNIKCLDKQMNIKKYYNHDLKKAVPMLPFNSEDTDLPF